MLSTYHTKRVGLPPLVKMVASVYLLTYHLEIWNKLASSLKWQQACMHLDVGDG